MRPEPWESVPGAWGLGIGSFEENCGKSNFLKAWYAQAKDWVEQRYGTCKQFHEDNIRKAFSNEYQNAATGRWELEGFKQDLSNMEGRRAGAPAGAVAPMALG